MGKQIILSVPQRGLLHGEGGGGGSFKMDPWTFGKLYFVVKVFFNEVLQRQQQRQCIELVNRFEAELVDDYNCNLHFVCTIFVHITSITSLLIHLITVI